ncbi:DNA alkylation repair protein [Heyndrickxia ginsengihumi]|uniref:DNA alkylation repair protein n=1 Tax=Heyndrickxia ginsengihumi TaxID=363870 RepID=A0A6M0P765_9BACI|nr:DNA alkylation repair protein [Heyndrickxia ginsengihumi]MBE6184501.1 DNA alkylation repair protein [Bacillus sp. (in: firmicutes)]MCM3023511.1 DNA alkylation repair protein [Heyndrickxia ginsengihumi]NEY20333.1 DNA alkylation repair protein [Heyndrickxia ginsengihumi]
MSNTAQTYIQHLINIYFQQSDIEYAEWSREYLRNQFDFLGIRTPIRRKLTKQFMKEYGLPARNQLKEVILLLWDLPHREYQKAALDILENVKKTLLPTDMEWLEKLIVTKSWWDTVDALAPNIMGYLFQTFPELIQQYPENWIESDNIWLQRSAILFQLKYKLETDDELLFRYILRRADSNEFFVQKAIGWVLREYAKTEPEKIRTFVEQHELKALSRREALKHL